MLIAVLALGLYYAGRAWFDAVERRHRRCGLSVPTINEEVRRDLDKKFPSLTREP